MKHTKVTLVPLTEEFREAFILENQRAFKHGAMEEFGLLDDHTDEDGEIISRKTVESCLDAPENEAYRIVADGETVGGVILKIDPQTNHNHLEILFTHPEAHGRGIGYGAWREVEALHPETEIWETCTPYFDKRNLHFYINKCGFSAVEFFWAGHTDPNPPSDTDTPDPDEGPDEMFRFFKRMK